MHINTAGFSPSPFLFFNILLLSILLMPFEHVYAHQAGIMKNRLDITQVDEHTYAIRLRVDDPNIRFELPHDCQYHDLSHNGFSTWRCKEELAGRLVKLQGLEINDKQLLLRYQGLVADTPQIEVQVALLSSENAHYLIKTTALISQSIVANYVWLGVTHILLGFDHILFVLALLLLIRKRRLLVKVITAFTIGHSITLVASTLGWFVVNAVWVEVFIALSIVLLAAEILHQSRGQFGWSSRWPWGISGAFGLLHGLGFASVLSDIGLPEGEVLIALLAFNVGVEVGQLLFVVLALPVLRLLCAIASPGSWVPIVLSYSMGGLSAFWFFDRLLKV